MGCPMMPLEEALEQVLEEAKLPFMCRKYLHVAAQEDYLENRALGAAMARMLFPDEPPERRPGPSLIAKLAKEAGLQGGGQYRRMGEKVHDWLMADLFPPHWAEHAIPLVGRATRANKHGFHFEYEADPFEDDYAVLRQLRMDEFAPAIDGLIAGRRVACEYLLIEWKNDFFMAAAYESGKFKIIDKRLATTRAMNFFRGLDGKRVDPAVVAQRYADFLRR